MIQRTVNYNYRSFGKSFCFLVVYAACFAGNAVIDNTCRAVDMSAAKQMAFNSACDRRRLGELLGQNGLRQAPDVFKHTLAAAFERESIETICKAG